MSLRKKFLNHPEIFIFLFHYLTDTISMEDGKLGLAELPETKIYILGHSVSHLNVLSFNRQKSVFGIV